MALFQRSFREKCGRIEISSFRFYLGILFGIFYVLASYVFFYLVRECIRWRSGFSDVFMCVLPDQQVYFYNFFFALIAALAGMVVCLLFWSGGIQPRKTLFGWQRALIFNDLTSLSACFLCCGPALVIAYGLFIVTDRNYFETALYPGCIYVCLFIFIMLFLSCWKNILRFLGSRGYRWMVVALFLVVVTAYILSRINPIDYRVLSQQAVLSTAQLQLPEADRYAKASGRIWIYLVKDSVGELVVVLKRQKIKLADFSNFMKSKTQDRFECFFLINQSPAAVNANLYADKQMEMRYVDQLKKILKFYRWHYFNLMVVPAKQREWSVNRYRFLGVKDNLNLVETADKIKLYCSAEREFKIQGEMVLEKNVVEKLKELSAQEMKPIEISYAPECKYQDYVLMVEWVNELFAGRQEILKNE